MNLSHYALVFALFSAQSAWLAYALSSWAIAYVALSFGCVALAYTLNAPAVFGKREGRLAWWAWLIFSPYLCTSYGIWHLWRRLSAEATYDQLTPTLYLGRRPLAGELPDDVTLVVDLTSELRVCPAILARCQVLALPTLDGMPPASTAAFDALIRALADEPRVIYVHCAQGHGRSALVAAAILLRRGEVQTPATALALLKSRRPGVALHHKQLAFLERWHAS